MPPCAQTECERFTGTSEMRSTGTLASQSLITVIRPARPPPTTTTRRTLPPSLLMVLLAAMLRDAPKAATRGRAWEESVAESRCGRGRGRRRARDVLAGASRAADAGRAEELVRKDR